MVDMSEGDFSLGNTKSALGAMRFGDRNAPKPALSEKVGTLAAKDVPDLTLHIESEMRMLESIFDMGSKNATAQGILEFDLLQKEFQTIAMEYSHAESGPSERTQLEAIASRLSNIKERIIVHVPDQK